MNTHPAPNKKYYKKYRKKSRKIRRRRRFLFFIVVIFACIFIGQTIQNKTKKNNATTASNATLDSANNIKSLSAREISARKDFVICIDPGHGYYDSGCNSEYLGDYTEKDINLSISELIRNKLQNNGFTVIMTRDSDVIPKDYKANNISMYTLGTRERCDFSNNNGADLFLSIHCNYFEDKDISGTRLYYYIDNTETTESYASMLQNGINDILGEECIVSADNKKEAYTVCYFTEAPAVLAEVGFVTNPGDAKKMLDSSWQDKYAESLVQGIISYFKEFCYNTASDLNNAE